LSPGKSLVLGVPGLCALIAAGRLFVSGATGVAANLGVDAFVIGVVLAAIGTSLPELVTVFLSPLRGHDEVGVGTLIGSNLFNGLFIVGVAGMIHPIDAPPGEVALTLAAGLVALLLLLPNRNGLIGRGRGVGLLLVYAGFIWVTISCFQRSSGWVTQRLEFAERRRSSIQQPISETLGNGGCGRGLVGEQWSRTAAQLSYLPLEHRMDEGPGWVARRPSYLWIQRRKAVGGVPIPESGQSPLSAPDPQRPDDVCKGYGGFIIKLAFETVARRSPHRPPRSVGCCLMLRGPD
jgi:hypothetical protein